MINNYNINNFLKNGVNYTYIKQKYNEINMDEFMTNLNGKWSMQFVSLEIENNDNVDYVFLRKCLKHSNFKLFY